MLLVRCAQHILGQRGAPCELRDWGLALAARGGKAAKKRAVVAVARKLAVQLHRVWLAEEGYDPFYATKKKALARGQTVEAVEREQVQESVKPARKKRPGRAKSAGAAKSAGTRA